MKRKHIELGKVYVHVLGGQPWLVKVHSLEFGIGDSRPKSWCFVGELLPGQSVSGPCWGYISELKEERNEI